MSPTDRPALSVAHRERTLARPRQDDHGYPGGGIMEA
jgi:hypothetical protein